jgi:ribokinase
MFFNLGSINIDYVYRVEHFVNPGETLASSNLQTLLGGKGANQSLALARAGAQVCHIGSVSQADSWAVELLDNSGVDVSGVLQIEQASGHAIIQVDDAGENAILLHGGANQALTAAHIAATLDAATTNDVLLMQNECNGLEQAMRIAKDKQMKVAFNPAPMAANVENLDLEICDVLILNEIEAAQLSGAGTEDSAAAVLLERFPNVQLVLTQGSRGASWYYQGQREFVAATKVDVVDTTAAGDTFVGYFLAAMDSNDGDAVSALHKACVASALAVTVEGASSSIPDKLSVEQFIETGAAGA